MANIRPSLAEHNNRPVFDTTDESAFTLVKQHEVMSDGSLKITY